MINQELPKKKRIIKSEQDNSVNRNVKPKKISNPQIPKKQNTQNSAKQVSNQKPINKTYQPKSKKVDSVRIYIIKNKVQMNIQIRSRNNLFLKLNCHR